MQEYERHEICKGLVETNVLFFKGKAPKWESGNEENVDFSMLDISQDRKEGDADSNTKKKCECVCEMYMSVQVSAG